MLVAQSYLTCVIPWTVAHHVLCPWDFLGKNTGVGCHFLLQGIFSTQGSHACLLCLLHCRRILYHWAIGEAHDLPYLRLESPGLNLYKLSAVLVYDMWKIALALNDRKLESFKANDAFIRIAGVLLDVWETNLVQIQNLIKGWYGYNPIWQSSINVETGFLQSQSPCPMTTKSYK